ncbi:MULTISPECIES: carotenoid 1,2-hydratase [unclassified Roseitalea]|uniref:carotenoid 1,2-hydratase n=1 Tax=unclassified Roseitalea TaxID=2639107 RepID=UPI00273F181A|nr:MULTISPECIES: carotenoid 1,2-hydratase [unclassified Roseitalea]
MSDCGRYGVSVIAFVGSVFSPYYAWRGRRDPDDHVCINVALYAPGGNRWTMTERGRSALDRGPGHFRVGPSRLDWDGRALTIAFDEIAVPRPPRQFLPQRVAGRITLVPHAITGRTFDIDLAGRQRWWPIAPSGDIAVEFDKGGIPDWTGHGYLDSNWGTVGLEHSFVRWDWARGALADGESVILYDADLIDGRKAFLVLRIDAEGRVAEKGELPWSALERGFWGVGRGAHADPGHRPVIARTLEDGPFYMRSLVDTVLFGQKVRLMHESLSGTRFANPIVKAMLPFRMPRRAHYQPRA